MSMYFLQKKALLFLYDSGNLKKGGDAKQNKKETLGTKLVMENAMGWGLGDLSSSLWASLEHL